MVERVPGPICISRVGPDWIDKGTMCRSRSFAPGPCNALERLGCVTSGELPGGASKAKFDSEHVYSLAPEAVKKRAIDLQIIGGDYNRGGVISIDNEQYLKRLIELGSGGKQRVGSDRHGRLQFYIIRGGAEGFLPPKMAGENAGNIIEGGSTTSGGQGLTFRFDKNDLLTVFDKKGNLVSSALLERPLSITGIWRQQTADAVYNAWANKEVFIRKNTSFEIPYLGLGIIDGFRDKNIVVDMHKQEDTNGCIFIVDPNTPDLDHKAELGKFEPQLIRDVLASVGKTPGDIGKKHISLGIMRVVDIR